MLKVEIPTGVSEKKVEIAQKSLQPARIKRRLSRVFSVEVPLAVTSVESSAGRKKVRRTHSMPAAKKKAAAKKPAAKKAAAKKPAAKKKAAKKKK